MNPGMIYTDFGSIYIYENSRDILSECKYIVCEECTESKLSDIIIRQDVLRIGESL